MCGHLATAVCGDTGARINYYRTAVAGTAGTFPPHTLAPYTVGVPSYMQILGSREIIFVPLFHNCIISYELMNFEYCWISSLHYLYLAPFCPLPLSLMLLK